MGGPEYVLAAAPETPQAVITAGMEPAAAAFERRTIVIDAGHGGHDPGTLGRRNQEKAVTLAAAVQLRDILLATGRYDVVLTRSSDVFLELDQRVAIARDRDANLYISLHADASASPTTRGATVYTVNARGQQRARQRVQSNAWTIVEAPQTPEVGNILLDLSMTDTKNQSSAFAETLRANVAEVSTMVQNPHREDNFYVLLAPDVPAVLLEMGFMSNPDDETNLTSVSYRKTLMQAVARSIDSYFGFGAQRFAGN
jgi:N-acetylmuramoyl-L-alanine amidase